MGSIDTEDPWEYIRSQTSEMRDRMQTAVDEHYGAEYFDAIGGPEDVIEREFPHFAWREFFIGCMPTNRELHQVYEMGDPYERDVDLVLGLNKQIRDEVKHSKIFANYCEEFGVDCDLSRPRETVRSDEEFESLVEMTRSTVEHDAPHYIAGQMQCGTEIMAAQMVDNVAEYLEDDYPDVARTLHSVSADEGDHIHVGRLVFTRFASSEDIPRIREKLETKHENAVRVLRIKKEEVLDGR